MYVESRKNGTDKPICKEGVEKRLVNRQGKERVGQTERSAGTDASLCVRQEAGSFGVTRGALPGAP